MRIKSFAAVFGILCVAVFLTGASSCVEFLEDPEKAMMEETDKTPRYVVTVHEIIKYKRGADQLEQDVNSFFGGTVCVNKNPFLHSRDIEKIEMTPRPGNTDFFDLKITLSSRGQKLWSAMAVLRADNKKLGFLIDGMYYRSIEPAMITEPDTPVIYLEGPFDPATAKGLTVNSERNFKIYNNK